MYQKVRSNVHGSFEIFIIMLLGHLSQTDVLVSEIDITVECVEVYLYIIWVHLHNVGQRLQL